MRPGDFDWTTFEPSFYGYQKPVREVSREAGVNHPSRPRAFNGVFFIRCVPSSLQMSVEPSHYRRITLPDHEHFLCVPFMRCVQSSLEMSIEPPQYPIQPVYQMLLFLQTTRL